MKPILAWQGKENNDNHGKNFNVQGKHFYPFVPSVDGKLGKKSLVVLSKLSKIMTEKMEEQILHVHVWINSRI